MTSERYIMCVSMQRSDAITNLCEFDGSEFSLNSAEFATEFGYSGEFGFANTEFISEFSPNIP